MITVLAGALHLFCASQLRAQVQIEVKALLGSATYALDGGNASALTVGTRLGAGAQIRTGPRSAIDLSLGKEGGLLRLTEKSTLNVEHLGATNNAVQIYLHLPGGTALGKAEKLPPGSHYEIKVANGIAGIDAGTQFRCHADGHQVLLAGTMIFVHVPAKGEPRPHPMQTPGPVYFAPGEGVRPAPAGLVKEIKAQFKSRLPVH